MRPYKVPLGRKSLSAQKSLFLAEFRRTGLAQSIQESLENKFFENFFYDPLEPDLHGRRRP